MSFKSRVFKLEAGKPMKSIKRRIEALEAAALRESNKKIGDEK